MKTRSDINSTIIARCIWTSFIGIGLFAAFAFYALVMVDIPYRYNDYRSQESSLFFLAGTFLLIAAVYSLGEWFILRLEPYFYRFALLWIVPNSLLGMFLSLNIIYNPFDLSRFQLITISAFTLGIVQGLLLYPYLKHWYFLIVIQLCSLAVPTLLISLFNGSLLLFSLPIISSLISSIGWWFVLRYAQREPTIHHARSFGALLKRYPSVVSSCLCVLAFSLLMLLTWREVWKPDPPPAPIYASSVEVLTRTFPSSNRNPTNEKYALVVRFPAPPAGHQLQIVVLTSYKEAYLEPVDSFYYSIETHSLAEAEQQQLKALLQEWCIHPPMQASTPTQLELAIRCADTAIGFEMASDDAPEALRQLFQDLRLTTWSDRNSP